MRRYLFVFILALGTLYSCDNDIADLGQNLIPNDTYVEVQRYTLDQTYMVRIDSFPTSSLTSLTMGRIDDPATGVTKATPYFQLYRASWDDNLRGDVPAVFDSLTLNFTYKSRLAGDTTKLQTFSVYQLKDFPLIDLEDPYRYSTQSMDYEGQPLLGRKSFYAVTEFMKNQTPYIKLNTEEGEALGRELFRRMQARDTIWGVSSGGGNPEGALSPDYYAFMRWFKGLVIVPDDNNSLLASIGCGASELYLRCHYHVGEEYGYFDMQAPANTDEGSFYTFTHIDHEAVPELQVDGRNLTYYDSLQFMIHSSTAVTNYAVIQGLSSYALKIRLPYIADANPYKTIVKAELEMRTAYVESSIIPQAQRLGVYVLDENGYIDYVLSDMSGDNAIYGYFEQDPLKPGQYRYVVDLTDYYIAMVEGSAVPLHQSLTLLVSLPGAVFNQKVAGRPNEKSNIITGTNSVSFERAIFEDLPSLNIYYTEYN